MKLPVVKLHVAIKNKKDPPSVHIGKPDRGPAGLLLIIYTKSYRFVKENFEFVDFFTFRSGFHFS